MKNSVLLGCFIFFASGAFAKIINGYSTQLQSWRDSLAKKNALEMSPDATNAQGRRQTRDHIDSLKKYITYYELTEELLAQLRTISPDIYDEIDTISDSDGNPVDIYVTVIDKEQATRPFQGVTSFARRPDQKNRPYSEYGEGTVAVKIWMAANSLIVLCHELGHISYFVPNYGTYFDFYQDHYIKYRREAGYLGHDMRDMGGKSAYWFEKRFRRDYARYISAGGDRFESMVAMLSRIRRTDDYFN